MKKNPLITKEIKNQMVKKVRDWFMMNGNGNTSPAVIGISGGKDSSIVAALCVEALGNNRVIGVMIPNGEQKDIEDSQKLCKFLKIKNITVNIFGAFNDIKTYIDEEFAKNKIERAFDPSRMNTNLPPRLRMATLYAVAQSCDGRVIGTGNASEGYVGWCTLYGDLAGDFNPIKNLFVDEVIDLGRQLGLPKYLIEKAPSDGLTSKTDEENLGFTYDDVKRVALKGTGWQESVKNGLTKTKPDIINDIEQRHKASEFKRQIVNVPGIEFNRWPQQYYGGKIYGVK